MSGGISAPSRAKRGRGKPQAEFSAHERKQVGDLAACGMPWESIARVLNRPMRTLKKYLSEEYHSGIAQANAQVAQSIYRQAVGIIDREQDGTHRIRLKPDPHAGIFWLKVRAGWKETQVVETTNAEDPTDKLIRAIDRIRDRDAQPGGDPGGDAETGGGSTDPALPG
jgi:hypothetical protein